MLDYILKRLTEPSSFAGIAVAIGSLETSVHAMTLTPASLGTILLGLAAFFTPEGKGKA